MKKSCAGLNCRKKAKLNFAWDISILTINNITISNLLKSYYLSNLLKTNRNDYESFAVVNFIYLPCFFLLSVV